MSSPDWRTALGADLRNPQATICLMRAVRMRLRRNYVLLFFFITAVWLTKLFIHPGMKVTDTFYQRLAVGDLIPSWFVAASASLFVATISVLAIATRGAELVERGCRRPPLSSQVHGT